MHVVAIVELATSVDAEAAALAADLRATAYDVRLLLAGGTPAVVRSTPAEAGAAEVVAKLRARGHDAVAVDTAAVVASATMTSMRRFRLERDGISLDDRPGVTLPYDDIATLVSAVHRRRSDTSTETRERKFDPARAIMSGGVLLSKTTRTATRTATEDREGVLYLFRRSGGAPWLLRERGTSWAGHGEPLAPSESENFRAAVAALRARAPRAVYDDRLVSRKSTPERTAVAGGGGTTTVHTSSEGGTDLLAHVIALAARGAGV